LLEDSHGVDLKAVFAGKAALPTINLPRVQVAAALMPPPLPDNPQCLQETPKKGIGTPISWAHIDTLRSGDVQIHNIMGSNSAREVMRDGMLVAEVNSKGYLDAVRRTFRQMRTEITDAQPADNVVLALRDAPTLMAWLRQKYSKSIVQVEADATVINSAVGVVAGHDADKNEELSSGVVATSNAGARSRARTKLTVLKKVTLTYSTESGHIATTSNASGTFRDSFGTDVL
jgi:hypothetical protein